MSEVADRLRRVVVNRAGNRCEYCRLSQEGQEATFHIDHISPRGSRGVDRARESGACLRVMFASEVSAPLRS